jgi:N-acetylmuramoyl-L-alanine amidase
MLMSVQLFQRPLGFLVAITLLVSFVSSARVQAAGGCFNETGMANGTVVLDPGHGGSDPGTSNTTSADPPVLLVEKDLTLDIANRTKELLIGAGYKVCMTRIDDSSMGNSERGEYANSVGGTVYVSIHLNGSSDPTINYTKAFYGKRNKDETFARHIYEKGLVPALVGSYGVTGSGVGQFANGALLQATMEATLTESVFLTNDQEADRLADTATPGNRRDKIAQALFNGITSWPGTKPASASSKPGPKQ